MTSRPVDPTLEPGTDRAPAPAASPDRGLLRSLFLFEALDDDRLDWISAHASIEKREAGRDVYTEGEEASCFFVLLEGTVSMRRAVRGDLVELNRTDLRGSYAGATESYVGQGSGTYPNTLYAVTDCEFVVISADDFAHLMHQWFPMAVHLLDGLFVGMRASQAVVGQRERLLALGQLTAGLTHELNNPAAAAVRATASLRERVSAMRHKLAGLASGKLDPEVAQGSHRAPGGGGGEGGEVAEAVTPGGQRPRGRHGRLARRPWRRRRLRPVAGDGRRGTRP